MVAKTRNSGPYNDVTVRHGRGNLTRPRALRMAPPSRGDWPALENFLDRQSKSRAENLKKPALACFAEPNLYDGRMLEHDLVTWKRSLSL